MVIESYDRFGGRSQETAPLTNVMHAMGIEHSEEIVFGAGGGIGASYFVFEYKGMPPNVFLGMRHGLYGSPNFLGAACRRLGTSPLFQETTSRAAARKQLQQAIAAGTPLVAYVCGKDGMSYHHVGVAGMDDDAVLLDDMQPAPVWMSLDEFAGRRAAIRSFKNRLLSVKLPPGKIDVRPAVIDGIRATARGMREAPVRSFSANFGLAGLQKFAHLLTDEKDKRGWANQFPPGSKREAGLRWVHLFTKDGAYRGMYADFLEQGAKLTGRKSIAACAVQYRKLERLWNEFAEMSRADNQTKLADLAQAMSCIHSEESAACASLEAAIS